MPKLKTRKTAAKRFRTTKGKKLMHRTSGQNHFNARESGKVVTRKRRDKVVAPSEKRNVRTALPYS